MKTYKEFMNEATVKRVWQHTEDNAGRPHIFKGYKDQSKNPAIGWFSNKHNEAAGWGIYPLDANDISWFKKEKEPTKDVFRVATDHTTTLVKFNFSGGTVAWFDNEHLMATDEIRFGKKVAYKKVILAKGPRANKETGLKMNDVPSTKMMDF
jgi:hypothetical protein